MPKYLAFQLEMKALKLNAIEIKNYVRLIIKFHNCTKDKANNPLGVCSVWNNNTSVITCPTRFREDWIIIENAANFAFGSKSNWTSISEIKLTDKNGQSAGNIDFVLVQYNEKGQLIHFVSLKFKVFTYPEI